MNRFHRNTFLIQVSESVPLAEIDEAARLSGMHPEMIEAFLRAHLVTANRITEGTPYFDPRGIHRLQQIQYFREHERANLRTIRYIVGLLDALDEKERELEMLRRSDSAHPDTAN